MAGSWAIAFASGVLAGVAASGAAGAVVVRGGEAHDNSVPKIQTPAKARRSVRMVLLLLEALGALLILVLIVWWTMFAGRVKGEPTQPADLPTQNDAPEDAPPHREHRD
jgi:high-affinity Fe2+/Pb2+ permease